MSPSRSKRPTQRDIAERAEVSITTVSHVVNGTRSVAPETRAAVLDAIEQTGYTGDIIARSLVTGGTRSLGVAVGLLPHRYFAELLQAMERAAADAGYTLLLSGSPDTTDHARTAIRNLQANRVEGLLVTPPPGGDTVIDELVSHGTPAVLVDRMAMRGDIDQVGAENVQATSVLTEHLAAHGHQRIGLINGAAGSTASDERGLGYRLGLGRAGLAWNPDLIIFGDRDAEPGAQALATLLEQPYPVTAIVVADAASVTGVLRESRRRNLRIGQDIAIVCSDDTDRTSLGEPPLTAMTQPRTEIGEQAVRLLLARIRQPDQEPQTLRMSPTLQKRASCGCRP